MERDLCFDREKIHLWEKMTKNTQRYNFNSALTKNVDLSKHDTALSRPVEAFNMYWMLLLDPFE